MKRILVAAVLPFLFIACAKEENTNPGFRVPNCADTTDEGRFEHYTKPEFTQFLRFFKNVPDTEDTSVVRYQMINGRLLYNRSVDFNPYIIYRMKKPAKIFAFLPFPNQPEKYYSWVVNAVDTTTDYHVNLYHLRTLQPQLQLGCYRLYYVVSDVDTGTVYTKGHYDLEIKN